MVKNNLFKKLMQDVTSELKTKEEIEELKIKYLDLDSEKIDRIKRLEYKTIYSELNESPITEKVILVSNIIGVCRTNASNFNDWYEFMIEDVHKLINFELYSKHRNNFNNVLMGQNLFTEDGLPHVIKKNNKYYIATNGKHRITIAKCIGAKQIKVIVTDLD